MKSKEQQVVKKRKKKYMVYLSYPIEKEGMNPEKKNRGEKLKWEEGAKGGRGKEG